MTTFTLAGGHVPAAARPSRARCAGNAGSAGLAGARVFCSPWLAVRHFPLMSKTNQQRGMVLGEAADHYQKTTASGHVRKLQTERDKLHAKVREAKTRSPPYDAETQAKRVELSERQRTAPDESRARRNE